MVKKETKDNIHLFADVAVIITVIVGIIFGIFQIYSWSQDSKLAHEVLDKQERDKNMPPTVFIIQDISGTSDNIFLNPCILVNKNSNKHFIITYLSTKIGRERNRNIPSFGYPINRTEDYPSRYFDDRYEAGSEGGAGYFLNNNSELENGKFCLGESNYNLSFDYNPIIDNYTIYNSSNKDLNIEYDIEIEDIDSEISYIGVIKTKIKGNIDYPIWNQIYRPLKFNWTNIGIQNAFEFASPIEQQILFNGLEQRTISNMK